MWCRVGVKHRDTKIEDLCAKLKEDFGTPGLTVQDFVSKSERFAGTRGLEKRFIFSEDSIDSLYAFLEVDPATTMIWIELKSSERTFQECKRIIERCIDSISAVQHWYYRHITNIKDSIFYEDCEEKNLAVDAVLDTWYTTLRGFLNCERIGLLVLVYLLAVAAVWLFPGLSLENGETGVKMETLFVQPSLYAPLAVIIYGVIQVIIKGAILQRKEVKFVA